ncbi:MAG: excinuclease ABC subunit UvrC [Arenimonas sp.]|nr:excinuclease ABC subunit UvrC [Arenimonas sp.]MBP6309151.1 excinuclease ABC subunit UvrC [Arenimonas sp.]
MQDLSEYAFDGKRFVQDLSNAPGVYRMYGAEELLLYVGKANNLKKRVANYFREDIESRRIALMVKQIKRMEVTVTRTESEALILENQLIKSLKPRYNILLRDDKSYPYIIISDETWPRISVHRGSRTQTGRYFGPYPSVVSVRDTLDLMQKIFRLRTCENAVFRNRSRPCLQHQIGRCSAPCVGFISPREYDESIKQSVLFLQGRSSELVDELTSKMDSSSQRLEFEQAAHLRDTIASIRKVQAKQYVEGDQVDMDVLAAVIEMGTACVMSLSFRNGLSYGTHAYFPKCNGAETVEEVLSAFVRQFYLERTPPKEIILSHSIEDQALLQSVLTDLGKRKVEIKSQVRGERARFLEMAMHNAILSLATERHGKQNQAQRLLALQKLLGLTNAPQRIECFDISHTMGEATVASNVVFNEEGAVPSQYRRFNISDITPGDDYAAMHQALTRRFKRAIDNGIMPDLLLIDGGEGQLTQARDVLTNLNISTVVLVGVAKGVERKAGEETLILPDGTHMKPGADSLALQLIQQVRDEAHRFAITGHRGRRQKTRDTSTLEQINGIGAKRRSNLLKHFGGLAGLKGAGVEEIARVEGINLALAERIYANLHGIDLVP